MSLLKDFKRKLTQYGLEWFGRYYGSYKGVVVDAADPEKLGRLKLRVPDVYGDNLLDEWALSKGVMSTKGGGIWMMPKEGDTVWVEFENGDPEYPIWNYGWFSEEDGPEERGEENYVIKTSGGNIFELSDDGNKVLLKTSSTPSMIIEISEGKFKMTKEGVGSVHGVVKDMLTQIPLITVPTLVGPSLVPLNAAAFAEQLATWNLITKE